MNEIMGPPSSWYNPPEVHEICKCEECHGDGEHVCEEKDWARWGCPECAELLFEQKEQLDQEQ